MAKILVADDNSNIQKMVVSALKNQGIDVVAVGNGEAAVRKISDVRPDLVLADVFMPVRNGYEVCKYVKDDSALSHIPVILLVGAFDPLDEQEAQRVGADGVLKKPFVPPDPLISMVKSALSRAGVSYSGAPPGQEENAGAASRREPVPPPSKPPSFEESEPFHEPVSKRPSPFTIDSGSQPLAFGSLLETPDAHPAEDEADYVTKVNSGAIPERDWGLRHEEQDVPEEEEEETQENSWRRTGAEELEEPPASKSDGKESAFEMPAPATHHAENWTPMSEKSAFPELAPEEPPLASIPEIAAPEAPPKGDSWGNIPSNREEQRDLGGEARERDRIFEKEWPSASGTLAPGPEVHAPQEAAAQMEEAAVVAETEQESAPPSDSSAASQPGPWYSVSTSPWESEAQKASQLAATWDTSVAQQPGETQSEAAGPAEIPHAASEVAPPSKPLEVESVAFSETAPSSEMSLTAGTAEVIREETAQVVDETLQDAAPSAAATSAGPATQKNLDDVVAKVLAKMSPEVLQAVTKEILKPVVEAMVRDELNKK